MSDNLTGLANQSERPNLHYEIVNPMTAIRYQPHPSRGWLYGRERMAALIEDNRILWPKKSTGRPRLKRFISDINSVRLKHEEIQLVAGVVLLGSVVVVWKGLLQGHLLAQGDGQNL